jgi:hypothetical protein
MSTIHSFVYFLAHQGHRGRDRMIVGFTTTSSQIAKMCELSRGYSLGTLTYFSIPQTVPR